MTATAQPTPTPADTKASTQTRRMAKKNQNTGKHGSQVKDDEQYEALKREGASKEKAARIANDSSRSRTGQKGGLSQSYDDWSKEQLLNKAEEVGIEGRSDMDKDELKSALRNH